MYNKKEWKRPSIWWDDFFVPDDVVKSKDIDLPTWVSEHMPEPLEHDYLLFTDGSGCSKGWGAYAAIAQRVDLLEGETVRGVKSTETRFGGTYGSTVQRSEFTALLEGLHMILQQELQAQIEYNQEEMVDYTSNPLHFFLDHPITIWWVTDRANIAKALLRGSDGLPLNKRSNEADLWGRYSAISKYFRVTPQAIARNTIKEQAVCDALCGVARGKLMEFKQSFATLTETLIDTETWEKTIRQKAQF